MNKVVEHFYKLEINILQSNTKIEVKNCIKFKIYILEW